LRTTVVVFDLEIKFFETGFNLNSGQKFKILLKYHSAEHICGCKNNFFLKIGKICRPMMKFKNLNLGITYQREIAKQFEVN
jgi:hypothetical protein